MSLLLERHARPPDDGAVSGRDLRVLAWICEQYGARVDHLALLEGCSERSARRLVARLRDAGLVSTRRLLVGEPAWAIPTATGARVSGAGFGPWQPRVGQLAHVAATARVRIHVQQRSPAAEWVCERQLARERRGAREHLPDAVVFVDGQRVAIEVELTVKSRKRTQAILDELSRRFDTVLYFCAPATRRQLGELEASGRWPKLGVRDLPA